jgi:DNA-directed RNA polymerase subunit E'/Rpb7
MTHFIITKKICVKPNFLDENLNSHILTILKDEYLDKYDDIQGYITDISNVKILENNISSTDSGVFFTVQFEAQTMPRPSANDEYEGNIGLIISDGIMVEVHKKIKIFVPVEKMGKDYVFDQKKNIFLYKKGKSQKKCGDTVRIIVEMVRYENQTFHCIGRLKKV